MSTGEPLPAGTYGLGQFPRQWGDYNRRPRSSVPLYDEEYLDARTDREYIEERAAERDEDRLRLKSAYCGKSPEIIEAGMMDVADKILESEAVTGRLQYQLAMLRGYFEEARELRRPPAALYHERSHYRCGKCQKLTIQWTTPTIPGVCVECGGQPEKVSLYRCRFHYERGYQPQGITVYGDQVPVCNLCVADREKLVKDSREV